MLSSRLSPPASSLPSPREPQLLRFRLRQMFLMVTLLCLLCGLLTITKGPWPLIIGLGTLLVAAHVFGALIGTRLRNTSHEVLRWRAAQTQLDADEPMASKQPVELANIHLPPETPLANHGGVCHWTSRLVAVGALIGSIVGGTALAITAGSRIGWPGWTVGTISCAVLGAWTAFLASSFSAIARHAWKHAHENEKIRDPL